MPANPHPTRGTRMEAPTQAATRAPMRPPIQARRPASTQVPTAPPRAERSTAARMEMTGVESRTDPRASRGVLAPLRDCFGPSYPLCCVSR